jgi:hypothetical protein
MSLRKSPTLTPARLEANRRNAGKSTGPRTARGKAQSRINGLRTGGRSALFEDLFLSLFNAPTGAVDRTARAKLTAEQAAQPLFAEAVDMFRQAETEVVEGFAWQFARSDLRTPTLSVEKSAKYIKFKYLDFCKFFAIRC